MEANYKIIGGDGREYGPVNLEELKAWIRDGRVGRQTQVWRSDMGSWLAASQYQELQPEIGTVRATSPDVFGDEFEPVGFWPRVGAFIIDGILTYVVFWILWNPFARLMGWPEQLQPPDVTGSFNLNDFIPMILLGMKQTVLSLSLRMIYEVWMNGRFGATVGKMIIGAKIVRSDGSPLGYKFAFFRFFARLINEFACHLTYLMVAFREDKRGLHDLIVGTRVIYKR
jgi:uncharacterized RDD family membrane protein YckC